MKCQLKTISMAIVIATHCVQSDAQSSFTNNTSITILDEAPASVYPSLINVTGMTGTITNITVTLNNLTHSYVHDMSVILQAPSGQSLLLQSAVADNISINNRTYTFSDAATNQLPASSAFVNGTYKPTAFFWDIWPAPAPPTPPGASTYLIPGPFPSSGYTYSTLNSAFSGLNPLGNWKLFIADFANGDAGILAGGWTLTITTGACINPTIPVITASSSSVCAGQATTLSIGSGTLNSATSWKWYNGSCGSAIIGTGNSIVVSPAATSTYFARGTGGCVSTGNCGSKTITVNSLPIVTASNVSACAGSSVALTGSPAGGVFSKPNPYIGPSTTYTYSYTNVAGCSATSSVASITMNNCNSILNVKLFLEGYYIGAGFMTPALLNQGIGSSSNVTDSIDIELRSSFAPYSLQITRRVALNTNGTASANFNSLTGNFYIVIKHRNAIMTWSSLPVAIGSTPITYDFSTAASKAYGNNQISLGANVWGFFSGDIDKDENVDISDTGLLQLAIEQYQSGYIASDLNGDGNADLYDMAYLENNVTSFVFSAHP